MSNLICETFQEFVIKVKFANLTLLKCGRRVFIIAKYIYSNSVSEIMNDIFFLVMAFFTRFLKVFIKFKIFTYFCFYYDYIQYCMHGIISMIISYLTISWQEISFLYLILTETKNKLIIRLIHFFFAIFNTFWYIHTYIYNEYKLT